VIFGTKISLYPEKYYTEGLDLIPPRSTIPQTSARLSPRVKSR